MGAFEKAATENATFRQLIHDKPNTVDLFFRYAKGKPTATVEEVLSLSPLTDKLAVNQLDDFIADFAEASFREAVQRNAELVEAWKVLKDAGITTISNKINDIKFVNNYLKKSAGNTAANVADEIKSKGWQKWADELIGNFGRNYFVSVRGFVDDIEGLVTKEGITMDDFHYMMQKSINVLNASEEAIMFRIRSAMPKPLSTPLMQKVIPLSDVNKYISGAYSNVGGMLPELPM